MLVRSWPGLILVALAMALPACQSQPTTTGGASDSYVGWTIVLDVFQGANHQAFAQQRASQFTQATGMTGFWVSDEPAKSTVNFGRYDSADSSRARQDLERLKALAKQGTFKPRTMMIAPSLPQATGPNAQWELRNARKPDAVYTLVIEQYTPAYGSDFRKQAEADCAALRSQMIETYYYHSLRESVVTLGQFGEAAAKIATSGPNAGRPVYHPFITDTLQKKYPYVKVNGKVPDKNPTPTFLIRIPE